jgi:acetoin utilization deacetylase AcuC-like enzyme
MNQLVVFYRPEMVAPSTGSFSPSASKPGQVVAAWQRAGLPMDVRSFAPATVEDLARAHDRGHVQSVLGCRSPNGFGNCDPDVARSLPYTSGAMIAAGHFAMAERAIACAPISGFHHAGYRSVGGYCTFNGLMVAALALSQGRSRIGILDCDEHYGNGTDEVLDRTGARSWIEHVTVGEHFHSASQAPEFFGVLPELLHRFADCSVVLYQAGADPHIDDPLGGWLTTEQLLQRDEIVFSHLHRAGVGVAWNFAGGYRRDEQGGISGVIEVHTNTAKAALEVL